jgi:hypothetical protein
VLLLLLIVESLCVHCCDA